MKLWSDKNELEERLQRMEGEFNKLQEALQSSQETTNRLEQQFDDAERRAQELEDERRLLEERRREAEEAAFVEKEEKQRLLHEAEEAQRAIMEKEEEMRRAADERRRLNEDLQEARRQQEEAAAEMLRISQQPKEPPLVLYEHETRTHERHQESYDDAHTPNGGPMSTRIEIQMTHDEDINLPRPEESRVTTVDKSERLQQQLKTLSIELSESKQTQGMTRNDMIHYDNVKQGRDKYKTLKQIRMGNTKLRVDQFEQM